MDDVVAFTLDGEVTEPSELPGLLVIALPSATSLDCAHDFFFATDVPLPVIATRGPSVTCLTCIFFVPVLFGVLYITLNFLHP